MTPLIIDRDTCLLDIRLAVVKAQPISDGELCERCGDWIGDWSSDNPHTRRLTTDSIIHHNMTICEKSRSEIKDLERQNKALMSRLQAISDAVGGL